MAYEAYNAYLLVNPSSPRDSKIELTKQVITSDFFNSPSYYQVQVNTSSNPNVSSNLDSWIVDDSKTKELKQIQLIPDQTLNFGDIITWNGEHWITTSVDYQGGIYFRGSIQKCPSSLKWLDSKGAIREAWFSLTTDIQRGLGIVDGKPMIMPNERRYIILQKNAYTSEIVKLQRFIFDEDRCWRVASINSLFTNLITMELEEIPLSTELDNVELRIANYYLHNYTVEITNGTSVNLNTSGTLQLNVTTKDNGVITDLPITYTTTDNTIATVDSTGLITCVANGTVSVKAALSNDPTVFSTMSVVVSDVVTSGWTLDITGNDYCTVNQMQRFVGEVKNNGITDTTKLIRWTLYDDSGTLPTTLGTIITQSGSDVVIKANIKQFGYIRLQGTCYAQSNFTVEDIAAFTVADLSTFTVEDLAFVGATNQTSQEMTMQTVGGLFNLGLTVEQMSTLTVEDLAAYTVGDLGNEAVLVSAMKRVQIRSLIS
jgi:hypothetical protein